MPATNPQTVLDVGTCFACYGVGIDDMMKLSLLDSISQTIGGTVIPNPPMTGMLLWFKPESLSGFAGGATINPWVDSSGNANDASLGLAVRPLAVDNAIGTYKGALFTPNAGNPRRLQLSTLLNLGDYEAVIVASDTSANSNWIGGAATTSIAAGINFGFEYIYNDGTGDSGFGNNIVGAQVPMGFYSFARSGNVTSWYIGTTVNPDNGSPVNGALAQIGLLGCAGAALPQGSLIMVEILMYDHVLSAGERTTLNAYMLAKFGLT